MKLRVRCFKHTQERIVSVNMQCILFFRLFVNRHLLSHPILWVWTESSDALWENAVIWKQNSFMAGVLCLINWIKNALGRINFQSRAILKLTIFKCERSSRHIHAHIHTYFHRLTSIVKRLPLLFCNFQLNLNLSKFCCFYIHIF